jgi:hypothetical protein
VQVRHDEKVGTRIGPEPCAAVRKGDSEASVGEWTGPSHSRRRRCLRRRTAIWTDASARACGQRSVVEEPGMCRNLLGGNREILRLTNRSKAAWSASGRRVSVADDARTREVRLCHSSMEVGEQERAIGCGTDGAKGRGPKKMWASKPRAGHRTGKACHKRWNAYGRSASPQTGPDSNPPRRKGSVAGQ